MKQIYLAVVVGASLGLSSLGLADERPPEGAKPMSELAKMIEEQGYSPITEISFDRGQLEVEAYKGTKKRELKVDPKSGKILSDRRDD